MNKTYKLIFIGLISINFLSISAAEFESNVAISSDYIWRGWTQSNEDPSISGGFDISGENGLYFGTWAASVTGGTELDYYLGLDLDFEEIYLGLSYSFVGLIYSAGQDDAEDNLELSFSIGDTGLAATFGQYDNIGDYYSITYDFPMELAGLAISLGYSDLSVDGDSSLDEDGFFITFSM